MGRDAVFKAGIPMISFYIDYLRIYYLGYRISIL